MSLQMMLKNAMPDYIWFSQCDLLNLEIWILCGSMGRQGTMTALAAFSQGTTVNLVAKAALLSPIGSLSHITSALTTAAAWLFVDEVCTKLIHLSLEISLTISISYNHQGSPFMSLPNISFSKFVVVSADNAVGRCGWVQRIRVSIPHSTLDNFVMQCWNPFLLFETSVNPVSRSRPARDDVLADVPQMYVTTSFFWIGTLFHWECV